MKKTITSKRLKYPIGSLGWTNFYGASIFLTLVGVFLLITHLPIAIALSVIAIGIALYVIQDRKLRFKSFKLNSPLDDFIENVRKILEEDGWDVEYDNHAYIQAVNRTSLFSLDLLTIKYSKNEIKWSLVNHPESSNSIASLISLNLKGKKTMNKIKEIAAEKSRKQLH